MKNLGKILLIELITFVNVIVMGGIINLIYNFGVQKPLAAYAELPDIPFYVFSSLFVVFMFIYNFVNKNKKDCSIKDGLLKMFSTILTNLLYVIILLLLYVIFY